MNLSCSCMGLGDPPGPIVGLEVGANQLLGVLIIHGQGLTVVAC